MKFPGFVDSLFIREPANQIDPPLRHAVDGMAGEIGEIYDHIKRHEWYGLPLDRVNLIEELGDLRFYYQAACNALGVTDEEVMATNIRKLQVRYPSGFSPHHAEHRNSQSEREAMERGSQEHDK